MVFYVISVLTLAVCASAEETVVSPEKSGEIAASSQDAMSAGPNAPISTKVLRYAMRIIARHDANGDGVLEHSETKTMRGDPARADLNGDGRIPAREFAQYVANHGRGRRIRLLFSPEIGEEANPPLLRPMTSDTPAESESGEAPPATESEPAAGPEPVEEIDPAARTFHVRQSPGGLPSWFAARDANGDGQVSMAEYAPNATHLDVATFARMDANGDGFVTPRELVGPRKTPRSKRALTHDSRRVSSSKSGPDSGGPDSGGPDSGGPDSGGPNAGGASQKDSRPKSEETPATPTEEAAAVDDSSKPSGKKPSAANTTTKTKKRKRGLRKEPRRRSGSD